MWIIALTVVALIIGGIAYVLSAEDMSNAPAP